MRCHGENFSNILNVSSLPTPVVVHSAQHVMYPLAHLERWRGVPSSRVMIGRGLDTDLRKAIKGSLRAIAA